MLRRVAAFCRPLRPVLLLVLFPRSQSPVLGVLGLCWMWQDVPFAYQRSPVVGVLELCWLLQGSFDCFCCPSSGRPQPAALRFRVREAQAPCSSTHCPGRRPHTLPHSVGRACAGRVPCWLRVTCASWLTPPLPIPLLLSPLQYMKNGMATKTQQFPQAAVLELRGKAGACDNRSGDKASRADALRNTFCVPKGTPTPMRYIPPPLPIQKKAMRATP